MLEQVAVCGNATEHHMHNMDPNVDRESERELRGQIRWLENKALLAYVAGCGRTVDPPLLYDFRGDSADMVVPRNNNTPRTGVHNFN